MSSQTHLQTLFTYHWRTTQRMIECAAKLSDDDYTAHPSYGHGSIHNLLFHLLRTITGWRAALETGRQQAPISPEEYTSLAALQAGFSAEQAAWQQILDTLSDAEIDAELDLINWRGDVWKIARWRVLHHLVLHGMQHHAELAQLLTDKGQSPGDIDFIFFRG